MIAPTYTPSLPRRRQPSLNTNLLYVRNSERSVTVGAQSRRRETGSDVRSLKQNRFKHMKMFDGFSQHSNIYLILNAYFLRESNSFKGYRAFVEAYYIVQ